MDRSILAGKLRARGFQVVQPLKCAGHASIFCVRESDEPSATSYVAKVVTLHGLDAKGRASAQQEVSLLKGLEAHPNLIAYRESFMEEPGILFIVMTLAEDGDLRGVVTESQSLKRAIPEPIVMSWLRQMLSGLEHLHAQAVVHRDLKSSNVFLCGGRRHIRIGDFGISRVLESTAFASSCVGTPAYMSPELMRNERYDYHVDMWALGCVIFELCTLSLPFQARSLLELACQVMETDPAWTVWQEGYSEELRDVSKRLLAKDAAARPTAQQLLEEALFREGGRGAQDPPDEIWDFLGCNAKPVQPSMLHLTTITEGSQSSKGGWTLTPRMPFEKSGQTANGSSSGDAPALEAQPAQSTGEGNYGELETTWLSRDHFSRDEFATLLSTHQEQLLKELRSSGSGVAAWASEGEAVAERPPPRESVL
eukprot:TRINITY_DN1647_c0_g1_i1.p1 TRINITY_DN1647_c0_g1~~TRINITY_DN1647_c0_g1_i1.p1  ORF type:complete len:424 (+),score=93.86 TRINITY_DN1647_c0_g1_i1:101-1372(+)